MTTPPPSQMILWRQTIAVGTMQSAMSLAWLLYRLYLPALLAQVGLAGTEVAVLAAETLLACAIEPMAGRLSDRWRVRVGTRFPLIAAVFAAAAAVTIALPLFLLTGLAQVWQASLILLLLAWAVVMALARSPLLGLLGQYAMPDQLPQAGSVILLAGSLTTALGSAARSQVLALGPLAAFAIASLVLVLSILVLRWVGPDLDLLAHPVKATDPATTPTDRRQPWFDRQDYWLYGLGIGTAIGLRCMFGELGPAWTRALDLAAATGPSAPASLVSFGVNAAVGLLALPLGATATVWGNSRTMIAGGAILTIALPWLSSRADAPSVIGCTVLMAIAWTGLFNGGIPLAIAARPDQVGWAIGLYFGGFSLGMVSFDTLLAKGGNLAAWGGLAFAAVAVLVAVIERRSKRLAAT